MKKWIIKNPDVKIAQSIEQNSNLNMLCSEILASRGVTDVQSASEFLSPCIPENPYIMKGMREAVEVINDAVDNGKKICIFGDYDCDGVVSTVMLYSYLQCIGADVFYYIPEREEGYGMNENAVRKIADDGAEIIITVDNGISAIKEADIIYELGMKLVVTDHHQPGEVLPKAEAVVNPHRKDCPSSFKQLCGAGVVLKLICAVEGGDYEFIMEQFGDIAAIATLADVVIVKAENRYIVQRGIEFLANTERPGLSAIMKKCGITPEKINAGSVSFFISPRINAAGRFGSPRAAVNLLMCEDIEEAERLADELENLNSQRKETENDIVETISEYINSNPETLSKRVLVFSGENWHHGVIGIVSARIMERFGKPCFIITKEKDGMSRGSARSFGDFSVFECLEYCKDLLVKFGGHKGAGGFSLKTDDIDKFDEKIQEFAMSEYKEMPVYSVMADKFIKPDEMTEDGIRGLKFLEPFGEGNEEPLFLINGATVENIIPLANGMHTKLMLRYGNAVLEALLFRVSPQNSWIKSGEKWSFIVSLGINSFRGRNTISATIKDYRKCGIKQEKYIISEKIYERYIRNEVENSEIKAVCPSKEELTTVYKYLGNSIQNIDNLYLNLEKYNIDLCKLRVCIDIFRELGLINLNIFNNSVQRIPVNCKVNLDNSEILRRLNEAYE